MKVIEKINEMKSVSRAIRHDRKQIAFVPTMGCLHEGHLSLVREAGRRGDVVVASIFVNPVQFGKGEDFDIYPRDIERDGKMLDDSGVDILFYPTASEIYPEGFQTLLEVTELSEGLCGASRPGHFRGVATVIAKLFNIVRPDVAIFGEKDYQQLAVIRKMAYDLNFDTKIIGMPIVRENDGLAMSSRNSRLSGEERELALALIRALDKGKELFLNGERNPLIITGQASELIPEPVDLDYMEIVDTETLKPLEKIKKKALFAIAAKVGNTRLIDNAILKEGEV